MQTSDVFDVNAATHGMQKVEGILALEQSRIILEEEVEVGDTITWFELPDGKLLISKDPDGVPIEKISPSYIQLEAEVTLEEK
jgi:hypothetical protein